MAHIHHLLPIKATRKVIYDSITTQKGLSGWWTKDCVAQPVTEYVNIFRFGNQIENKMKIIDLQPESRVEWECINSVQEWIGTRVVFELIDKEGVNYLNFLHIGYENEDDFFASCNYNWGRFLMSLKNLCETGKGSPFNPAQDLEEVKVVRKKFK